MGILPGAANAAKVITKTARDCAQYR